MHPEQAQTATYGDLIYPLASILEVIDLAQLFPKTASLEVELGSGDGAFLVQYARENSERNFIGVERLLGRLRKIDKKGRRAGLANLRAVRIESAYFLRYLLPAHCASALHIYFPDPWPKRKHQRHRLINESFPALAQRALEPGGKVYLRTDDADYFEQMFRVFETSGKYRAIESPAALAEVRTSFELDFNARGIVTLRSAWEVC